MTSGHRGASGLPSGWLDDPLGSTIFRPAVAGAVASGKCQIWKKSMTNPQGLVCNVTMHQSVSVAVQEKLAGSAEVSVPMGMMRMNTWRL